jgi:hypothetical protein
MGLLDKRRVQSNADETPTYTLGKKKRKKVKPPNWLLVIITLVIALGASIYVPPLFFTEDDPDLLSSTVVAVNEGAMVTSTTYLKNLPDSDFDGDSLSNEKEIANGSNPYSVDTDGDGTSDYAELYITETNPRVANDAIINRVKMLDAESGKQVNTPIKIHNIVLWPEDYQSRARGGVVRTLQGYRFCGFTGWAQFPDGEYPYRIRNGRQEELKQNDQGYYRIENGDVSVIIHNKPPVMGYEMVFIGGKSAVIKDNLFGDILSALLPNEGKGLIVCKRIAMADIENRKSPEIREAAIVVPEKLYLDDLRFGRNMNELEDLAVILRSIDNGECVVLSLYSQEKGEAFVLAYGYSLRGNILVADIETGEKLGAINYMERATRILDATDTIQQYEFFTFSGCGFSSSRGNRISILSET